VAALLADSLTPLAGLDMFLAQQKLYWMREFLRRFWRLPGNFRKPNSRKKG